MDVLFFLNERTKFIHNFYVTAAGLFRETVRKIEAGEVPFDNLYYGDDDDRAPSWNERAEVRQKVWATEERRLIT